MTILRTCCTVVSIIVMSIMTLTAISSTAMLAGGYDAIFNKVMHMMMQVTEGSQAYEIWKDVPVPMRISFYLFNLTNPEEFEKGAKPVVEEIGPYVYREYHEKVSIDPNYSNYTISYFQRRWWIWDYEASGNCTQNDTVSLLNIVPVAAAYAVKGNAMLTIGLNLFMDAIGEKLTISKPAHEVIFDGYEDPLLSALHNDNGSTAESEFNLTEIVPDALKPYDKMAWFYKRNNSDYYDGQFNMFTGEDTLDRVGLIDWWNKTRETKYFAYPCNKVDGSAGEMWPPGQTDTSIVFYSPDLCRTVSLPYKETTEDPGLEGYRYWIDNRTFAHPDEVPENQCYCFNNDTANCFPSGTLDAQTCRMGSPALISLPHFLHGDEVLLEGVEGITPATEEKHQFHIDMIPELGVPLRVAARMQINMRVQQEHSISILADVKDVLLPMIWFEVSATVTNEMADDLTVALYLIRTPAVVIFFGVMLGVSVVLFLVALCCCCCVRAKARRVTYQRQINVVS